MCFVAGVPLAPMARWVGVAVVAATVLALAAPYRRTRVLGFLDPWSDPLHQGYQSIQSLVGLASGGFAGTGLGASRAKWGFLPFAHTDFIFAIIGEELGFVGAAATVVLFALLLWRGMRVALRVSDAFGALVAVGVTALLATQAAVNLGVVVGLFPTKGLPLPFVSSGGSSLLVAMTGVGLLLNVSQRVQD